METVGILLAGGKSTRFGSPKAFAHINDEYFYEHSYKLLAQVCDQVIIVTLEQLKHLFPKSLHVITDLDMVKGKGPLAGIYSAMYVLQADRYVVLPCDMPFLSTDGLIKMLELANEDKVYAIKLEENYHPLVSCWPQKMLPYIYDCLQNDRYSVMRLLHAIKQTTVWLDGNKLFDQASYKLQNINRLDQMKEVKYNDDHSTRQFTKTAT